MEDDELSGVAMLNDDGGAIAGTVGGERSKRPPEFIAGPLVERNDGSPLTADQTDQLVSVDERMSGKAPDRRAGQAKVLDELFRPDDRPVVHTQAVQVPFRAECV